jgi:hypothetical protein
VTYRLFVIVMSLGWCWTLLAWARAKTDAARYKERMEHCVRQSTWRLNVMLAERDLLTKIIEDNRADPALLDSARDILYGDSDRFWENR